ncbi:MAG: hypothetical protein IPK76_23655 [Lewinellaceae bacterium]|jgi:hypothetical protein|nr:hypothetical protein [Lewinellaceae bacterium]
MVRFTFSALFLLFAFSLFAQKDMPAGVDEKITEARASLLAAFLNNDQTEAAVWQDSLMLLEDSMHVGLVWDERWLLYYWEGTYGNLFDEIVRFDEVERLALSNKKMPAPDSLFTWLDRVLYEQRFNLYEHISRGFLSEEEKQFALIELDYLLRLNQVEKTTGEWNKRLDAFVRLHSDSRFNPYIRANLYTEGPSAPVQVRKDRGFTLDVLFASGRWQGKELERTLRSPYGFDVGLAYWVRRWNLGLRCTFGWQKLSQSIFQDGFEWPKNDPSVLIVPSLEVGYDIFNNRSFRLFPSACAGFSILKPPGTDEQEDNPQPDYYSDFFFARGFLGAACTADVKLKYFDGYDLGGQKDNSYISARIRVGYNWLNWDNENPQLLGNMFYFAVGINLFSHTVK